MDLFVLFSSSDLVQPKPKSSQDPYLDDIDLGLGRLHSFDLRSLGQPSKAAEYEDNNGGEKGDGKENEVGDNGDDLSKDSDFNESSEDVDEEGDDVSLTNSDERSEQVTDSDLDDLRNPDLKEEIPRLIDIDELGTLMGPIE